MDRDNDAPLLKVAEAIADGQPVDWDEESRMKPRLRRKLGRLRSLEALAGAHRSLPEIEAGPGASGPDARGLASQQATLEAAAGVDEPADQHLTQWGPLRILEKLGQGGFGDVYRVYDPALQREVALKLRRTEESHDGRNPRRFLEEARRLARVRHPNVLVVHGADEHEGRVGLWTDLVKGRTLEECLVEQGPFSDEEACLIGMELCRALAAVHAAGLVHRDVKTSNVMRQEGGRILLMDFGSGSEAAPRGRAAEDRISGTPMAMAPEVLTRGEAPRPSADIYSLGVLLYRLVSRRYPVEADSLRELLEKHRRGEFVPLRDARPDLPTAFVQVVERALSRDPDERFASAGAMERALAASRAPVAELAGAPRAGWARSAVWVKAAALAVLLAVTLWLWLRPPWRSFSVEAALFRQGAVTQERMTDGVRVSPGDRLFLEFRGTEPLYVYVLNEDAKDETWVLFPAGLDLSNPLPPGVLHRLPGALAGTRHFWTVTSVGTREAILVIASRRPLADVERVIAGLPRAELGRPIGHPRMDRQAKLGVVRGIGGISGDVPVAGSRPAGRLEGLADLLRGSEGTARDVWWRLLRLENPEQP